MCKRLVISSSYYEAVQREDVDVVDGPIERVIGGGVVTADGRTHELDVLVLATGFDAHAYVRPIELVGEGGRTLSEAWSGGPRAYRTVAVPGFPNMFMLLGPHSPIGNHSLMPIAEAQAEYALRWIELWRRGEVDAAAPTEEATHEYNERSAPPCRGRSG
jgi:cation diffusion facilitator CzcD-associated flavoprotein CzcO